MEDIPEVREVSRKGCHVLGVGGDDTDLGVRLDGAVADVVGADNGSVEIEDPKLSVDDFHGVAEPDIDAVALELRGGVAVDSRQVSFLGLAVQDCADRNSSLWCCCDRSVNVLGGAGALARIPAPLVTTYEDSGLSLLDGLADYA